LGDGHVVFRVRIDCEGCGLDECVARKHECMSAVGHEVVSAACLEILTDRLAGWNNR
jgi:hypothetical protein